VGAELLHVDRQTDIMKLTVTFHNVAHTPKHQVKNDMKRSIYRLISGNKLAFFLD